MAFANGSYVRIWRYTENKSGKSGYIDISTSRKDKNTGAYETDFRNKVVTVAGTAFKQMQATPVPEKGINARIAKCAVSGDGWDKDKHEIKPYNFVVWALYFEGDEGYRTEKTDNMPEPTVRNARATTKKSVPAVEPEPDDDSPF